jgi:hypothetical protein
LKRGGKHENAPALQTITEDSTYDEEQNEGQRPRNKRVRECCDTTGYLAHLNGKGNDEDAVPEEAYRQTPPQQREIAELERSQQLHALR